MLVGKSTCCLVLMLFVADRAEGGPLKNRFGKKRVDHFSISKTLLLFALLKSLPLTIGLVNFVGVVLISLALVLTQVNLPKMK